MSTDFSIKPVGAPAVIVVAAPVSEATSNAVPTALPASQSVTVPDANAGVRNDAPPPSDFVSHQAFLDRAAGSIVYQVIDGKTDQVVEQFPDDATLRRRAYYHTLDLTKGEPTRLMATDLKA
jgi:hypothetical protein